METWYVLEDGTSAPPRDVMTDDKGRLVHRDGRKVDYAPHGPRARSVDPEREANRNLKPDATPSDAGSGDASEGVKKPEAKEIRPVAGRSGYKTREAKAD